MFLSLGFGTMHALGFGTMHVLESWLRNNACYKSTVNMKMARNGNTLEDLCTIFVPVSCEHTENLDFHPGLTSYRSRVNGA